MDTETDHFFLKSGRWFFFPPRKSPTAADDDVGVHPYRSTGRTRRRMGHLSAPHRSEDGLILSEGPGTQKARGKKQKAGVPRRLRPRGRPQINFRLPPPPQGLLRRLPATEAVWLSCRFFVFRIFGGLTRIGEIADDVWENWMYRWWFRLSSQCRERSNQLQINVVSKERIYRSRSQCCQRDSLVTMV